jgi:hypothetical protein
MNLRKSELDVNNYMRGLTRDRFTKKELRQEIRRALSNECSYGSVNFHSVTLLVSVKRYSEQITSDPERDLQTLFDITAGRDVDTSFSDLKYFSDKQYATEAFMNNYIKAVESGDEDPAKIFLEEALRCGAIYLARSKELRREILPRLFRESLQKRQKGQFEAIEPKDKTEQLKGAAYKLAKILEESIEREEEGSETS